jgi:hypothetical protein
LDECSACSDIEHLAVTAAACDLPSRRCHVNRVPRQQCRPWCWDAAAVEIAVAPLFVPSRAEPSHQHVATLAPSSFPGARSARRRMLVCPVVRRNLDDGAARHRIVPSPPSRILCVLQRRSDHSSRQFYIRTELGKRVHRPTESAEHATDNLCVPVGSCRRPLEDAIWTALQAGAKGRHLGPELGTRLIALFRWAMAGESRPHGLRALALGA